MYPADSKNGEQLAGGFMGVMKRDRMWTGAAAGLAVALTMAGPLTARGSHGKVDENDPTLQLFQLIDSSRGGVLKDFCVLADVYTDSDGAAFRHVLRLNYEKSRTFAKLELYVRSVGKMDPAQLATYTPQQIYDFGEVDQEKFMKTDPGPFGQEGDLYLVSTNGGPLHTEPVTDAARKAYSDFITQYIVPALKAAPGQ
jgi:hypothetical protein